MYVKTTMSKNNSIEPPAYYRANTGWRVLLGLTGKVTAVTTIRVAGPHQSALTPYQYAIVAYKKAGDTKLYSQSFMVADQSRVAIGDSVAFVLRKRATSSSSGLIEYGVKVKSIYVRSR